MSFREFLFVLCKNRTNRSIGQSIASLSQQVRNCPSDNKHIEKFIHRRRLELPGIQTGIEYRLSLFGGEAPAQVGPELLNKQRYALIAASAVAYGILHFDLFRTGTVTEEDLYSVCN